MDELHALCFMQVTMLKEEECFKAYTTNTFTALKGGAKEMPTMAAGTEWSQMCIYGSNVDHSKGLSPLGSS